MAQPVTHSKHLGTPKNSKYSPVPNWLDMVSFC